MSSRRDEIMPCFSVLLALLLCLNSSHRNEIIWLNALTRLFVAAAAVVLKEGWCTCRPTGYDQSPEVLITSINRRTRSPSEGEHQPFRWWCPNVSLHQSGRVRENDGRVSNPCRLATTGSVVIYLHLAPSTLRGIENVYRCEM